MQYERLVEWARGVWDERWPGREYVTIWASAECSNMIAQNQVRAGRKLRGKARRLFVPLSEFSFASFPIEVTRVFALCAGAATSQVTLSSANRHNPPKQEALSRPTGI